jgi:molybdenum cofactor biosynthesis enzyme
MSKLTHIDGDGAAHMVDVGDKADSVRDEHGSIGSDKGQCDEKG